jgi:hypothetical protein
VTHQPYEADTAESDGRPRRARSRAWLLLLIIPMAGTLIPPIYNTKDPTLIGIPFFYWYLMGWVLITVGIMALAERTIEDDR